MSRGLGLESAVASALEPAEPLLALMTQLGDAWFLVALGVALYWLGARAPLPGWDRRHGLVVLGVALWALAATYLLKVSIGLPRPAGAAQPVYAFDGTFGYVYAEAATGTGFGFPSGHAVAATAVYVTLAWLGRGDRPARRLGVAAGLIALVGLTRIGLGVHYLIDVLAGVAVGLALAAVAVWLVDRPGIVLALAGATAVGRAFVGPIGPKTAALLGMPVGALVGWAWFARTTGAATDSRIRRLLPATLGLGAILLALALHVRVGVHPAGVALAALGGGVLFVSLPVALRRENG